MRMFAQSRPNFFRMLSVVLVAAGLARSAAAQDESAPLPVDNDPLVHIVDPQTDLRLVEKFAKILDLKSRISTVYGFDPEIVHVTKVDMHPNEVRVHGLAPGVTSLVLVDEKNASFTVEVFVIGDVRHLQAYLKNLFPSDAVTAIAVRDSVVLRGYVTRPEDIPRIMDIAKEFYPNVINQMEVGGDQEVELKVRVLEVDRTKMRELGFNFYGTTNNAFMGSLPGALAPLSTLTNTIATAPQLAVNPTNFAANPSLLGGIVNNNFTFNMFLDALASESLLKILASPVLVTTNGQPANLLSGGEFPILVPQSLGTVTIQWKEFGVRLTAVPILLGNGRVRLNLQPEVSQKDFSNAVTTGGLTVPGLTTRRVNTSVEMRFGETFMLGGLTELQDTAQTYKTPFLGELPYIGAMFRRVSYQTTETELVILVTPVLAGAMPEGQVPPGGPGMFTEQPTDRELYWYGLLEAPSYGGVCNNCNNGGSGGHNYPPPTLDFDMGPRPAPLFQPVPVQELPPIREQFSPNGAGTPPPPAAAAGTPNGMPQMPQLPPGTQPVTDAPIAPLPLGPSGQGPSVPPMQQPTPPAQPGANPGPAPAPPTSASRWWFNPNVSQVSAQSTAPPSGGATQALYSTTAPSGLPMSPAVSSNASSTGVRTGLYEPQSGLYVPGGAGAP
jgi:pilus assembly protein CpaC